MPQIDRNSVRWPPWAWWDRPLRDVAPRHAVRILSAAASFEELVYGEGGPPLDRALQAYQRARRQMGRNDRAVLAEAVYHLARNRQAVAAALPRAVPGDGDRLLLAFLDRLGGEHPGRIPHLPGGVRPWLEALDRLAAVRARCVAVLEEAWDASLKAPSRAVREALPLLFSVPAWWLESGPWDRVGPAVRELALLRTPQKLILRAQPHRTRREAVIRALRDAGVPARPTARSPWGIVVDGRHNVLALPALREGDAEVQDEGSQLVVCLCDPKPGERVLDLCAGGGGKTLGLASAMEGRGVVVAYDPDPRRLLQARRRVRRAGLGNVRIVDRLDEVVSLGPYDVVLVDAPCTSAGTLRRNPDAAWRWRPEDLDQLTALQARILDTAAGLVKAGGFLVYATCSFLEPENRLRIERFLCRHGQFEPAPPGDRKGHAPLLDIPGSDSGVFRFPGNLHRYYGDAFFVARLRRRPALAPAKNNPK